jgi:hypothetical protein
VDTDVQDRLVDRYLALDKMRDGFLDVGVEVPSAAQVGWFDWLISLVHWLSLLTG